MALLTDREAQELLRVSRTTLWRLRKTDSIPFLRVGGEIRYRDADLARWLESESRTRNEGAMIRLSPPRDSSEQRWKALLESEDWAFHDENTDDLTHALHPYPAKFPPGLPARLLRLLAEPGQVVLDPFCGSGTTLVEACRTGLSAIGTDVNPIAVLASRAKTVRLLAEELGTLTTFATSVGRLAAMESGDAPLFATTGHAWQPGPPPRIPNLAKWFSPTSLRELGILRSRIEDLPTPNTRTVAAAVFSAIVVAASNQDSETRYTARAKEIARGDILSRYAIRLRDAIRMHVDWSRHGATDAKVLRADARALPTDQIGSVDLVVTSPPYANAFDYHLYHRHRLYWLGHDPAELRAQEIGSHLNHQRRGDGIVGYAEDMRKALLSIRACLRKGGVVALVVGDSVFHGKTIDNGALIARESRRSGYRCIATTTRLIHPVKRSVIRAARRAREERIFLLVREG